MILKEDTLLLFDQCADGTFITIDSKTNIKKYECKNGQLDVVGHLYVNEDDKQLITTLDDYEDYIINEEVLVVRNKLIYLHNNQHTIIDGVLESEDLVDQINSDYAFNKVDGPEEVRGQDQFYNIYHY